MGSHLVFQHQGAPGIMTWLLYASESIFNILYTKFIFREIILRSATIARQFQNKTESVDI
jgi:hypothetical protein